jgi:hypothetical protein
VVSVGARPGSVHAVCVLELVSRMGLGAQVSRPVSRLMVSMPRHGGGASTRVCCKYKWEESEENVAPFSSPRS